ncbi:MAG: hypothetical protein LBK06_03070 [Planctomycetaceae bacterium]|nr:hypothetical protein [Planctomycetaceae bacterium]
MRFNVGTIISFVLLLSALLVNVWRHPQVREMFGQEMAIISVPSVLPLLQSNLDNSDSSNDSVDPNQLEEPNQSDDAIKLVDDLNQPNLPANSPNVQEENLEKNTTPQTPPQPALTPQPPITPAKISPEPNYSPTHTPESITPKIEPQKNDELLPEMNLISEMPPQNILLPNISVNNNSTGSLQLNVDPRYEIYSHNSQAAAELGVPKQIIANQYSPDSKQKTTAIKQNRLINTIDTTLERSVIYD